MKIILAVLLAAATLFGECDTLKGKVNHAHSKISKSESHAFYTKWATIGTFYATLYAECKNAERHTELKILLENPTVSATPIVQDSSDGYY